MKRYQLILLTLLALMAIVIRAAVADDRPTMRAIRVADGAIRVDGRLDDWAGAPAAADYRKIGAGAAHQTRVEQRGNWSGPDDHSIMVMAAVDSTTLYIAGTVTDQVLLNAGGPDDPWIGDDFEVFVDANPLPTRFAAGVNENCLQFIFVPEHLWQHAGGTFIWHSAEYPGVRAASRLTPTGYTIEVAIPTALFPNWKANPNLDSIGFDVMAIDFDTPGVVGHDTPPKTVTFALAPDQHFKSAAKLGLLTFDATLSAVERTGKASPNPLPGYDAAQSLLDGFDSRRARNAIKVALRKHDLSRKSALFLLAAQPELLADTAQMVAAMTTPAHPTADWPQIDARIYAMIALAERGKLPAATALQLYGARDDLDLRFTALYCLGMNGDKSIVPELARRYPLTSGYTQEIIARSLAELGDKTGVPTLQMVVVRDKNQRPGVLCAELLNKLGVAVATH